MSRHADDPMLAYIGKGKSTLQIPYIAISISPEGVQSKEDDFSSFQYLDDHFEMLWSKGAALRIPLNAQQKRSSHTHKYISELDSSPIVPD